MSAKDELKRRLQQKIGNASLTSKWMPRKGADANKIRAYLKLTPKNYRKLLVGLSNTVEQKMCARAWDEIEYGKLPSVASARYQKAFGRNDTDRYVAYLAALEKGEEKINAGAVYPYDVLKSLRHGNSTAATEQWKALPDYLDGSDENILPVVDVSGSMNCQAGGSKNVSCMDVAVSLGLYLSERNTGVFKDTFVTFSSAPEMVTVSGNLQQRMDQMIRSNWSMSTNIQAVFETILAAAVKHKVPETGMPTTLLILSDMEFDQCVSIGKASAGRNYWAATQPATADSMVTAMEMIEQRYADAGYKVPKVVFWNLNARPGNVPVEYNKVGAALVSGFSPAIMTSLLGGKNITPEAVMLEAVMVDRYKI